MLNLKKQVAKTENQQVLKFKNPIMLAMKSDLTELNDI